MNQFPTNAHAANTIHPSSLCKVVWWKNTGRLLMTALPADTYHITLVEPFGTGPGPRMTSMCAVGSSVMFLGGMSERAR